MISLCMIVKNEERWLERCLNSVQSCVGEMIVVDTGSDDRTVEIAERLGALVYRYRWDDDFAAARNFGIDRASGDWILYLDADEELEPGCQERLKALAGNPDAEGYLFLVNNLADNSESVRHINLRMFRNRPGYRFRGRLHEQILEPIYESGGNPAQILNSGLNIFHYGYLISEFTAKNKAERNYRINRLMVEQEPDNPFYLYSLGNSCINLNLIESAVANYLEALKHIRVQDNYAPSVFIAAISGLVRLGRLLEAVDLIEKCKTHYPDYVDIHFVEAELYTGLGCWIKGLEGFRRCLDLGEQAQGKYTTRTGVGSFLPCFEMARIYKDRGDYEQAIRYQVKGMSFKPCGMTDLTPLAHLLQAVYKDAARILSALSGLALPQDPSSRALVLARLMFEIKQHDASLGILNQVDPGDAESNYLKGMIYLEKGMFPKAIDYLSRVPADSPNYRTALLKIAAAHWLSSPPRDAAQYIQLALPVDMDLHRTLLSINHRMQNELKGIESLFPPTIDEPVLETLVKEVFALNQHESVLKILSWAGITTLGQRIEYLSRPPVYPEKLELLAKVSVQELKAGRISPDFFFLLAWYFSENGELKPARRMLDRALSSHPDSKLYHTLSADVCFKQVRKFILTALETYPDDPVFSQYLLMLHESQSHNIRLKGVH